MTNDDIVSAAVLVIGDEILSGRTKDKNIGVIADHLTAIGIQLREVRIVPDVEAEIVDAVNALRARYTYVFSTGGIGPTHDDITADSMARAFGVAIAVNEDAHGILQRYYDGRGLVLTPARRRMARIPDGASLIANAISAAPGFMIGNVIVLAGVPDIMAVMLDDVTARLKTGSKMHSETIAIARPESEVSEVFGAHQAMFPDVQMGSYPRLRDGKPETDLVLRAIDPQRLLAAVEQLRTKLSS